MHKEIKRGWDSFRAQKQRDWDNIRPFVGIIVGAVLTYFCGPECGVAGYTLIGAASGAAGAAANGGNILEGAVFGAISGAAFGAIGAGNFNTVGRIALSGIAGGTLSVLQGGKFGHGFVSAGIGSATGGIIKGYSTGQIISRALVSGVIAGTVSEATGGKFANGAVTAAFSSVVNSLAQRAAPSDSGLTSEQKADLAKRQGLAMDEVKKAYESGALGENRQFSSTDAAAKEVLSVIDSISQANGVELGGFISPSGEGFTYGRPFVGDNSSMPGMVNVPVGAVAGYHTHPSGSRFFSPGDTRWVNGANGARIPLYMSARGQIRVCGVSSSACSPTKSMFFPYNSSNPALQGRVVK